MLMTCLRTSQSLLRLVIYNCKVILIAFHCGLKFTVGETKFSIPCSIGVKQGDVLGPILFTLYIAAVMHTWRESDSSILLIEVWMTIVEWVECMSVVSGRGYQEAGVASGWNLWVWLECIGVVSGCCCCKTAYRYPHNNYYFFLLHLY